MAHKDRTKEVWLIPKRVNLHQTICLIDGIIERNYNGTSWNPQKQNNLGVNLKNWGATKTGKNISQQAIRTLVASIPQYLGFVYINTDATPNTICLTEAGMALWNNHKRELVKISKLSDGEDDLINESPCVLRQLEKLQITNPIIQKDCENIHVFPFRFMLKVLLKVGYLDKEEIAYHLFKVRNEDEVGLVVNEINNFRKLNSADREKLIEVFKNTHIGNITLVQAASSGYYMSLCLISGIIEKYNVKPENRDTKIAALKIKDEYVTYADEILNKKYNKAEVYDFADNLPLWIEYIGNPERDYPPINVCIHNSSSKGFLIQIFKGDDYKFDDLIDGYGIIGYPMFVGEEYSVVVIEVDSGVELNRMDIVPSFENRDFELCVDDSYEVGEDTYEDIKSMIMDHCESRTFNSRTLNYLNTIKRLMGVDRTEDKHLRGAYLEYYFYRLLSKLREEGVIDDVNWYGRLGKYGLPSAAPGGRTGTPDITFLIDNTHFVLELTTIKAKAQQFQAEGSSVPDHIRLHKELIKDEVVGIFCAPIIHERNTNAMVSTIAAYGIKLRCMTDKELIEILDKHDRLQIKKELLK